MTMPHTASTAAETRAVAVILRRTFGYRGQWQYPIWRIEQVRDLDATDSAAETSAAEDGEEGELFRWERLTVSLHRDGAEGYWYNLSGNVPSVFVVCRFDEDEEEDTEDPPPLLVTVNHDEAASHLETDDTVLSIEMPATMREWLQRYVDEHYRPVKKKKRRRVEWDDQPNEQQRPRVERPIRQPSH